MWKTTAGSTGRLLQLCFGYFGFYVLTGVLVKYFTALRSPKLTDIDYLFNNTLGGSVFALAVVFLLGWFRLKSNRMVRWGPVSFPSEVLYILPSGICTAVVIPTTTLMYTLPISVMVAMVIMRGSIIVISRLVDELQIRQGILRKRVYAEENWAVVFALLAVSTNVLLLPLVGSLEQRGWHVAKPLGLASALGRDHFDFLRSAPALIIMGLYIAAYAIRIYIMNYYKNTRGKGVKLDNQGFLAVEQIFASLSMLALGFFFYHSPDWFGWVDRRLVDFRDAVHHPDLLPILSGVPYGAVAFFSVFIFMFKGRTATFAGLVNRLTSLLAGTAATLLLWMFFPGSKFPSAQDWVSVLFILVAVYFLTRAEKLRTAELARTREA
ncbi:MAG: hypothetical protein HZB25_01885 [Candidatus Eisenbacteria bacterium]|nr:hypothetical protein [Candidatus Eisenbacteria bacterium]